MNDKIRERIEKIRRGEVPEGYRKRLNWIIPNEWELMSGSDLFSFIRNGFVGTVTPFYTDIGIPYLQGMNIKDGNIVKEKMFYVTEEFHRAHPNSQLKYGDVVVVQSGAVGECAVIGKDFEQGNCHALIIMTPKEYVNSFWFAAVLNSPLRRHLLAGIITGNTIQHILASDMKRISVPTPSYAEQNYIAKVLAAQDRLLLLQRQRIDQIKKLKEAYLDKLFPKAGSNVPEIRFAGFTDPWEQRKLGKITQITMGQSPDGATYSDTPSDYILVQGNADLKDGWVFPRVWTTQKTKTADAGDLIMSVRAPAGAMGKTAYNVVLGRGVAGIKGNEFIYQTLVKMDGDGYWKRLAAGSTFESINSDVISCAEISIPQNVDEQNLIGAYFKSLDTLITLHQRKLDEMKKLKKGLMQLLLTGIVRVGE